MALHCGRACRQYLLHLAHDNVDFRLPEIKALLSLRSRPFDTSETFKETSPFWQLNGLSEEDVQSIMSRTVCAKSAFELWGHGRTTAELKTSLLQYPAKNMALDFLPFKGKVNLKDPDHIFCLLEDYGSDPNFIPEQPFHIYFGRWIADGQRELIRSYSVKKRHFIGNTSMDAGLSFIMANHAKVKANDLVYDPFVGTGSLLVACSRFGAYVCGTDIDFNTIHGIGKASRKDQKWRGPDENIQANLRQYGTESLYVDVMVSDASKHVWRKSAQFDAIVTDPPYGIRESTRRTGSHKDIIKPPEDFSGESHVPVSMAYHLSDIFADLLNFAAHHLVLGGRLIYWLPVYKPEYCVEMVPLHPCLTLISNCEQTLSSQTSRRLITMEKTKEPEESDRLAHLADPHFTPYQGHNSFREKYFSGLTKKNAKDNAKSTPGE
ncbi:tRNA (guanine(10)-N2)-methyltransferase homolog isoform X4 [Myxocyprinus asiaticus]|uniref:tRNA (guanine(10)-N2)-methyltransferase homolog isoform X4 n=1 Tax=Myxocyprinus asiaticus TaxID=70543 RepID=UPI0022232340|nr:tRNA (guanine(10)-N2)-methyltransferase homolog isoform X4 [Myxocyprinus asiaticus]